MIWRHLPLTFLGACVRILFTMEKDSKPEQNDQSTWSPWGDVFVGRGYTQVPPGIYAVLDRMGFKMGRDRVVIALVRRLRPGYFKVRFRHDQLAAEAHVSRKTVYTVLQTMKDNDAKMISSGDSNYTRVSQWDLMKFIIKVIDTEKLLQEEATAEEKAEQQFVAEIEGAV